MFDHFVDINSHTTRQVRWGVAAKHVSIYIYVLTF